MASVCKEKLYALAYAIVPEGLRLRLDAEHYGITQFMEFCAGEVKPSDRVLDAGAGGCVYRNYFSNARYEATDVAWDYAAQPKCPYAFLCSIDRIPQPDNTYDAVVNTQVLEHVEQPLAVLREFFRITKPGGKLFLTAPQGWGIHMAPHHYFNFTKYGLESLFKQAGYRVVFIRERGGIFWYLGNRIRTLPGYIFHQCMASRRYVTAAVLLPFYVAALPICKGVIPLLFFYLDRLDRVRDYTLGYACYCVKPVDEKHAS